MITLFKGELQVLSSEQITLVTNVHQRACSAASFNQDSSYFWGTSSQGYSTEQLAVHSDLENSFAISSITLWKGSLQLFYLLCPSIWSVCRAVSHLMIIFCFKWKSKAVIK